MFKKKDSKTATLSKPQATALAQLIAKMQKYADMVEKDILRAEELLAVDAENDKKQLPFQHQEEISDKLGEAEGLLKELFLDVDKAKKNNHPQAQEIETDVIHLHDRWLKDCSFYRDVYEQIDDVSLLPIIDWGPVFSKKEKQVNTEAYGPTMADVEKQIATHNILHKEIEAYNSQLCLSSAGSKDKLTSLKKQYNNLLDNSKWRHHYLKSLYDYMQGCDKELAFLGEEQKKIIKQDWSDEMVDPPDVRRRYENFKSNSLVQHEIEVNKLQDEGDRLIGLKHPASITIQAQRDAIQNEWQNFLNLCICQETHLENVEAYRRFQLDTEQLSDTLNKLDENLKSTSSSQRSKATTLLQLEGGETVVQNSDKLLADLRRRSTTIAPLKLRRVPNNRPITVESLCDWETEKDSLSRGDKFALKSNSDNENWVLVSANGATKTFPGVCFMIPPPDPDSIDKVDILGSELADIKKRRAQLAATLKNHQDVSKVQKSAPVSSAPPNPKLTAMAEQLDKLDSDLTQAEESMLSRLRAPLNKSNPAGDLAQRLKEQEKAEKALKDLEQKRQDLQPIISKDLNGTSSALPLKLSDAANKHDGVSALTQLYNKKAKASLNLENQIKKTSVRIFNEMEKHIALLEKNILRAEELMSVDAKNVKKQYHKEVFDNLGEAERLVNGLFLDMGKVDKTKHPHIQNTKKELQDRWEKVYSFYRKVYKQIDESSLPETASGLVVVQDELSPLFRKLMGENNQINMFDDDSLVDWTEIDKGGFGSVYKARHKKMGHDLAIKILHDVSVEESLLKEATFQKVFSCNYVLRTYGMYRGILPNEKVRQQGIVMEFMTRGSLMDLCKNLKGPPPFPLACRMIQEVASGMRFLHSMGILHRDLKLQNVMLSEDLHAKLADFGLCTMSVTCCPTNEEGAENSGTLKYTPPEAYDINYKPVRSFDVYSFAIFLWAVLSGEEPFPSAPPERLRKCVAKGQRPTLKELSKQNIAGMNDLLDLMQMCWNADPTQRPTFTDITPKVEKVYLKHKSKILHNVYEVLQQLDNGISDNLESSQTTKMDEGSIEGSMSKKKIPSPRT